jgi:hypothetical protein
MRTRPTATRKTLSRFPIFGVIMASRLHLLSLILARKGNAELRQIKAHNCEYANLLV